MNHGAHVHSRTRYALRALTSALLVVSLWLAPLAVAAEPEPQRGGQGSGNSRGFSIGDPAGFVLLKGGFYMPRGDSDIYSFNEDLLTLDSSSYLSGVFGVDVGVALTSRVDLVFGFEYSSTSPVSEFRDFVDEFDSPIVQQTHLKQVPLTASVRINLVERGRSVGSYAWIPSAAVPYVGAGAAMMW